MPEILLEQKLKQLLDFGVYSVRATDGAIFNRRMIKDQKIREIRQKAGKKGGNVSFASRFAQAKSQANTDNENESENENLKDLKPIARKKEIPNKIDTVHAKAIQYFCEEYQKKMAVKYVFHGGKDGTLIRDILKAIDLEDFKKRVDKFFSIDDGFVKEAGYTLGVFKSQINKLLKSPEDEAYERIKSTIKR